jgi:glutamate/tyrosine decarboxylase-like PLP-dependent enzyme
MLYASAESHLAWLKIAHYCGMGRRNVRLIETDGAGRMNVDQLVAAIEKDLRENKRPVMIAATAGTTNAGMVDPLDACAHIATRFGLWLHVDAAWGGALIASERERDVLRGLHRAHSITIDAHKWFATTMGTGMFLTKDPTVLNRAFHVKTDYMPSNDTGVDLYVNSVQWSRRFVGLRLFLPLATVGWEGIARHVERAIDQIQSFNTQMANRGWQIANNSRLAVSCLIPPKSRLLPHDIVDQIVAEGKEWISVTRFEGHDVIRVCVTNGRTQDSHLEQLAIRLIAMGDT